MDEGIEHDDKYRMVEDEFHAVAQRFTVHLHAAEYKRQQKSVKAQKADEINSISRPVTGKMPDQTKRKLESIKRSKTQQNSVAALLNKKPGDTKDSDDSDDAGDLPYVGTTLHGLMDSPRKKGASLGNVRSIKTTTRAAAGFSKSSALLKSSQISESESPKTLRKGKAPQSEHESSTDDDDDLGAPIPAPKLVSLDLKRESKGSLLSNSHPMPTTHSGKPQESLTKSEDYSSARKTITAEKPRPEMTSQPAKSSTVSTVAKPRKSRLELLQSKMAKQEVERKKQKQKQDVIPMFLGS